MRRPLALLVTAVLSLLVGVSACSSETPSEPSADDSGPSTEVLTCGDEPSVSTPALIDGAEARIAKNDVRPAAPTSTADVPPSLAAGELTSCPADMVLVEGEYCTNVKEECLEWMDPPNGNLPQHRCKKFAPSVCVGERVHKRFCIDKDEYAATQDGLPQGDTSWTDAKKTCEANGKRLCMESEWQFACEGEEMRPYPYGFERDPSACNFEQGHLVAGDGSLRDGRVPVTSNEKCLSPFGVHDMVGNIDEWVVLDKPHYSEKNGGRKMMSGLKGGWWGPLRNRCRPTTVDHDEQFHELQTGFRCCADPARLGSRVGARARPRHALAMASPSLTLYVDSFWISPYVFSCFVALREKGLAFETKTVALEKGEQRDVAYKKRTLTGRVPALEHGDFTLAESSAIVDYLEEAFPAPAHPRILPENVRDRARARQILAWVRSDLMPIREERSTNTMFYEPTKRPLSADAKNAAEKLFFVADTLLADGGSFLFGSFGIADADLAFMLHRLILNGDAVPEKVATWAKNVWQRPSVQAFVTHARPPFVPY